MAKKIRTILLLPLLTAGAAENSSHAIFKTVDFSQRPQPATFSSQGVEVTLQPTSKDEDGIDVAAAIRVPGYQSIIVNEGFATSSSYERGVGIGKISANDPVPSVLLTGFTGGAHCCATLRAIVPVAGKLKVLAFEEVDGEPDKSFPSDVDGDGTVDFLRQDDSFRYQFSSGAGSFSPPVILNIYKGNIVDVSSEPAFRAVWTKFAIQTRSRCMDKTDDDRNGACAAYVAAEARLGKFEEAMAEADKWAAKADESGLPSDCKVELVQYQCPKGQEIKFYAFRPALVWFLRKNKYID
jgi:hypothetical protein